MSDKEYIEDPNDIRLNEREELQQILGNPPGRLLHWGNTFIAIGVAVFLVLGWMIKYPDVIPTQVILTTPQPPIRVFSEISGKLNEFNVKENQQIEKGRLIAVLDNPAELEAVNALDGFLKQIEAASSSSTIAKIEIPRNLKLGGLQKAYTDFTKSFDEHVFFLKNNNTSSRIQNLDAQILKLKKLGEALVVQKKTSEEVLGLSKKELDRNREVKSFGGVSATDLETSEGNYLRAKRQLESLENEVINNNLMIERTKMQILENKQSYAEGKSSGVLSIQEDIQRIRSEVESWKKMFLIKAPISGKISLTKFRSTQQFINQNEELLTIVPNEATQIIAKGILPSRGSGKVQKDMRANIRLAGYPYQEFGSLVCKVSSISLVPQGDGFSVELDIPQPLTTTYDRTIPFQQEMLGTANIITEDRRILERVFDRILSILKND